MAFGETFGITFPEEYRQHVKDAVESQSITWGDCKLFASSCIAEFSWAGCLWVLEELFETVMSIYLTKGTITEESIIIEKLKNGNT